MYFLLQGCNVPEISLLNLKNPCVSFFKAIMQKGTKFISLFWTMKTMISSDFVGECYWVEISQSFSLHNGSHRSLCRLFVIHTVSQVIFTFIWQVFTLYRYCRAEVNQCRTCHTVCGASLARAEMLRMPQDQIKTQVWILWGGKIIGRSLSSHL